jgi:two-component system cell cycle response regulator
MTKDPPEPDERTPPATDEVGERHARTIDATRARFDERLALALSAAQKFGESVAVLLIDLDHFAKFNEQHGRAAGDAVLATIHRRILASVGTNDVVTRFGEDDFAVLCRSPIREYGSMLAQRLCSRISQGAVEVLGAGDAYFLTASIGVCLSPSAGVSTPADFVTAAARALHRAKASGRHRVVVANDLRDEDE